MAVLVGVVAGIWLVGDTLTSDYASALYHATSFEWVELTGPWMLTHYGTEDDGYLGQRTGASWNGVDAPDWTQPGEWMPEEITLDSNCAAMPGPEFYGLPILVCVRGVCAVATAVDVPAVERVRLVDDYYMHADLCNQPAAQLNLVGSGIITGARVYVGRYIGGDEQWLQYDLTQ